MKLLKTVSRCTICPQKRRYDHLAITKRTDTAAPAVKERV